eukprot:GDKI01023172.1.p1 GENE.GDKI01023172.1~~GDKI01023172.1.p1  ORF type:complete len:736 (-),score=285.30 GDKI01023172.1:735-2942(-)
MPQVQRNRTAEQVRFGDADGPAEKNISGLASEFQPTTDFEKEMQEAIEASGITEENFKEAGGLPTAAEIIDAQRAQGVARLKHLLAREQRRNKRLNKIKSKMWHKIHRKAEDREKEKLLGRLDEENPELAKQMRKEYEEKRAKVRMMKEAHARQKWAQMARRFGGKDVQKAITEQNQKAHDEKKALERIVKTKPGGAYVEGDESSDDDIILSSDSEDESMGSDGEPQPYADLATARAKALVLDELKDSDAPLPKKGIFSLPFMQKAIQEQRESAKREASALLEELSGQQAVLKSMRKNKAERLLVGKGEEDYQDSDAEGDVETGDRDMGGDDSDEETQQKPTVTISKEELDAAERQVDQMMSGMGMDMDLVPAGDSVRVSGALTAKPKGDIAVSVSKKDKKKKETEKITETAHASGASSSSSGNDIFIQSKTFTGSRKGYVFKMGPKGVGYYRDGVSDAEVRNASKKSTEKPVEKSKTVEKPMVDAESNPWISASAHKQAVQDKSKETEKKETQKKKETRRQQEKKKEESESEGEGDAHERAEATHGGVGSDSEEEEDALAGFQSKQASEQRDLIRKTFAAGKQEEEFYEEAQREELEEQKEKEPKVLPGWGDWAGNGVKPKKQKEEPAPNAAPKKKAVLLSGKLDRKAAKYYIQDLPFPFKTAEQYEATLQHPLGAEWNTAAAHNRMVQPKINVRIGAVIPPLEHAKHLPKKQQDSLLQAWDNKRKPNRTKARF